MHHFKICDSSSLHIISTQYLSSWQRSFPPSCLSGLSPGQPELTCHRDKGVCLCYFLSCPRDNQNCNTVYLSSWQKGVYLHHFCLPHLWDNQHLSSWQWRLPPLLYLPCLIDNHWLHYRDQYHYLYWQHHMIVPEIISDQCTNCKQMQRCHCSLIHAQASHYMFCA